MNSGDIRRCRLGLGCLLALALGSAQTAQAQCDSGNASTAVTRLKVNAKLLDAFSSLSSATPPTSQVMRKALENVTALAGEIDQALLQAWKEKHPQGGARTLPVRQDERQDFQCLQQKILEAYALAGTPFLHAQDRLARGLTALRFCIIHPREPRGVEDSWTCPRLLPTGLSDFQHVIEAALQIQRSPGSFTSGQLAVGLGISNVYEPAPDFSYLGSFVDHAVLASTQQPSTAAGAAGGAITPRDREILEVRGNMIGASLGPVLCNAMDLYPDQRLKLERAHSILVRFDGGSLAGTGEIYQAFQSLAAHFRLTEEDWRAFGPPCSAATPQELPVLSVPDYSPEVSAEVFSKKELDEILPRLEQKILDGAERLRIPSNKLQPSLRYGDFLYRAAATLRSDSYRNEKTWSLRYDLVNRACGAMMKNAERFHASASQSSLLRLQTALAAQIREYGEQLLQALRFSEAVKFVSAYVDAPGAEVLLGTHFQQLRMLVARGYYLSGDTARATLYITETDWPRLEDERSRLESLGVRRRKP